MRSAVPALRNRLLRRLRREDGFTLVELLVSMSIMLLVITGLASVFVAGSNAEVDLRNRFQAQSEARLALHELWISRRILSSASRASDCA